MCQVFCGGGNNILVQFEYGQKREIIYSLLVYVCSEQELFIDMDDPISCLPKNKKVNC